MFFCIVNCKEDYDHLKLACKPIFQKINTLYGKASIEVEGKHFDLDILMGGDKCKKHFDLFMIMSNHRV
jgi:transcriptional antiterminator Rof (Rho-off)